MSELVVLKIVGVQELVLCVWANDTYRILCLMMCPVCLVLGIIPG